MGARHAVPDGHASRSADRSALVEECAAWDAASLRRALERALDVKVRHAELLSDVKKRGEAVSGEERNAAALTRRRGLDEEITRATEEAGDHHLIRLNRREWGEVFTDFHVLRSGKFLCLSQRVFDMLDPGDSGNVNFVEAVTLLILSSRDSPTAQMAFAFEVFDLDRSGSLSQDELARFVSVLADCVVTLGFMESDAAPNAAEIAAIVDDMFAKADIDADGRLSQQEWVTWSMKHVVGQQLVKVLERHRTDSVHPGIESPMEMEPAVSAATSRRESSRTKTVGSRRMKAKRSSSFRSKTRSHKRATAIEISTAARLRLSVRMVQRKLLQQLVSQTNFSTRELSELFQRFRRVGAESRGDKAMTATSIGRRSFAQFMEQAYPGAKHSADLLEQLFDAWDKDNDGRLDFGELALGLSRFTRGTLQDKIDLLFEVYDINGDGYVSVQELIMFVNKENHDFVEATEFAEELVSLLASTTTLERSSVSSVPPRDTQAPKLISRDQFAAAMEGQPVLFECFSKAVLPGIHNSSELFKQYGHVLSDFSLSKLRVMWKESVKATHGRHQMSLPIFRKFMIEQFNTPIDALPLVNELFRVLDVDGGGTLSWKELFMGLSTAMAGTPEERARFYFEMYDVDGSGKMDVDEILTLLLKSEQNAEDSMDTANGLLRQLDADGDGTVTLDEFKGALKKMPEIRNVFTRLFGAKAAQDVVHWWHRTKSRLRMEELHDIIQDTTNEALSPVKSGQSAAKLRTSLKKLRRRSMAGVAKVIDALQSDHERVVSKLRRHSVASGKVSGAAEGGTVAYNPHHAYHIQAHGVAGRSRRRSAHNEASTQHAAGLNAHLADNVSDMRKDVLDSHVAVTNLASEGPRLLSSQPRRRRSVQLKEDEQQLQRKIDDALQLDRPPSATTSVSALQDATSHYVETEAVAHNHEGPADYGEGRAVTHGVVSVSLPAAFSSGATAGDYILPDSAFRSEDDSTDSDQSSWTRSHKVRGTRSRRRTSRRRRYIATGTHRAGGTTHALRERRRSSAAAASNAAMKAASNSSEATSVSNTRTQPRRAGARAIRGNDGHAAAHQRATQRVEAVSSRKQREAAELKRNGRLQAVLSRPTTANALDGMPPIAASIALQRRRHSSVKRPSTGPASSSNDRHRAQERSRPLSSPAAVHSSVMYFQLPAMTAEGDVEVLVHRASLNPRPPSRGSHSRAAGSSSRAVGRAASPVGLDNNASQLSDDESADLYIASALLPADARTSQRWRAEGRETAISSQAETILVQSVGGRARKRGWGAGVYNHGHRHAHHAGRGRAKRDARSELRGPLMFYDDRSVIPPDELRARGSAPLTREGMLIFDATRMGTPLHKWQVHGI